MKTITVKQPWAYLLCAGIKDIENRTWKTNYRGRVLIHASAKPIVNGGCISHFLTEDQYRFIALTTPPEKQLDTCFLEHYNSAIIGSVEIIDCVVNHPSIWAEKSEIGQDEQTNEWFKPIYNWVLANPILFDKPIENVKGKLGFWDYPIKKCKHIHDFNSKNDMCTIDLISMPTWSDPGGEGTIYPCYGLCKCHSPNN